MAASRFSAKSKLKISTYVSSSAPVSTSIGDVRLSDCPRLVWSSRKRRRYNILVSLPSLRGCLPSHWCCSWASVTNWTVETSKGVLDFLFAQVSLVLKVDSNAFLYKVTQFALPVSPSWYSDCAYCLPLSSGLCCNSIGAIIRSQVILNNFPQ